MYKAKVIVLYIVQKVFMYIWTCLSICTFRILIHLYLKNFSRGGYLPIIFLEINLYRYQCQKSLIGQALLYNPVYTTTGLNTMQINLMVASAKQQFEFQAASQTTNYT